MEGFWPSVKSSSGFFYDFPSYRLSDGKKMKMTYTCLKIEFHQSQLNPQTYLDLMRLINHFTPQHLWGPFFSSRVSFTPKKNNKLRKHAEMVPFLLEKNKPSGFTHPFRPRFLDRSCFFPCVAAPEARPEKAEKKIPR